MIVTITWFASALALLALATGLFNAVWWRRGRDESFAGTFDVLIPARDEEGGIAALLSSVDAGGASPESVWVCDDHSRDATREIVDSFGEGDERIRAFAGRALPSGWVGKPHACHQLGVRGCAEWMLFLDADVRVLPGGFRRLFAVANATGADVVSAVPRQETVTWAERWIVPLLHVAYVSWLPMPLVHRSSDPRFLAACGQVLLVRRSAYEQIGGFASVREDVVDDMAFCRRAKEHGMTVAFADGHQIAACRMYGGPAEVWTGFSKNTFEGLGGRWVGLLGAVMLFGLAYVWPFLALLGSIWNPALVIPATVGVGANMLLRVVLAVRHRHPWDSVLVHPLAVLGLIAIAFNSARWVLGDRVAWRGRVYARRSARGGASARGSA